MLLKQKSALTEQAGTVFQIKAKENSNCFKEIRMMLTESSLVAETLEILFYICFSTINT